MNCIRGGYRGLTVGLVCVCALSVAAGAEAQDADTRARTHFESGRLYFEEGAYDRAHSEFLRAWELSERPQLLINLATVEERLAMYESAAGRLELYLQRVPEDGNADQLRRRIANLRRLQAERGGNAASTSQGDAVPGASSPPVASSAGTPANSGRDGLILGGVVGLGVGVAGFVLQGVFGGLALSEDAALQDGCGATASCTEADVENANTFAAVSDAMMVVGMAGVAAGATLLILGLLSSDDDAGTARFAPYVDPHGGGVAAGGSF
ncbi:MAG: tol-pal system YbgF family protein [Sandaracinaceae bacterium]